MSASDPSMRLDINHKAILNKVQYKATFCTSSDASNDQALPPCLFSLFNSFHPLTSFTRTPTSYLIYFSLLGNTEVFLHSNVLSHFPLFLLGYKHPLSIKSYLAEQVGYLDNA